MRRRLSARKFATSAVAILSFLCTAQAQNPTSKRVSIKNFGCINENFYRGAQPSGLAYRELADLGVKTIIDLQRDGRDDERGLVEAAGMKFVRIGMSDRESPSMDQAAEFLKVVSDPANQPIFVHCKGGRHRTGAMTAVYRITHDGWSADQAFKEMKDFDFTYGMGHGALKDFVFGYPATVEREKAVVSTSAATSTSSN
ncbi:MAG TPA: dual specificity protein phosphatase family protein [Blastocatellia bacterium]|nr:dual specificity protein phosphatase family protein [Blastocatellia bacterium]